jgi:hypothetical protein
MAAQEKFPAIIAGQWVPICEQVATRQALIVSMIGGAVVLGITQAAPDVVSAVGTVPAGIFLQGGDVSGPGIFRASSAIDADLVTQEWFAWLVPGTAPAPNVVLQFSLGPAALAPSFSTPWPAGLGASVAIVFCVNTAPALATINSALFGNIAPLVHRTLNDASTDSCIAAIYFWNPTGLADTITFTASGTDQVYLHYFNAPGGAADVSGSAAGSGSSQSVTTAGSIAASGEAMFAAVMNFAGGVAGPGQPAPPWQDFSAFGDTSLSPDGTQWWMAPSAGVALAGGPQTVAFTFAGASVGSAAIIQALTLGASPSSAGAAISVFESWEVVEPPEPPKTFTFDLPRLPPHALATLKSLLSKVEAASEPAQEGE